MVPFKVLPVAVAVKVTVPVPQVKVPELVQLPSKDIAPVVASNVPVALILISPELLNVLVLRLNVELAGTVRPAAYTGRTLAQNKVIVASAMIRNLDLYIRKFKIYFYI